MVRLRTLTPVVGAAVVGYAVARHLRLGRPVSGGVLMGDAGVYDQASRVLLGSFYRSVADDVAGVAPAGGRVLEVGCGPGHLSVELANRGLDVTGVDLDPAMIERARVNARRRGDGYHPRPSFDVADVASLAYADDSFELVVSTLSLHHWADPAVALSEIARVLRPAGRALIWDLGSGRRFLHGHMPDPAARLHDSPLRLVDAEPWRWPFRFTPIRRLELAVTASRTG